MSAYQLYKGKMCVRACTIILTDLNPDGLIGKPLWDKWVRTRNEALLQRGGRGRTALYELAAVPEPYYSQIIARWGDPEAQQNALSPHFRIDAQARAFYDGFRFADGGHLTPEQVTRYTVNASALNALGRLLQARTASRKSRGGSTRGIWNDLAADMAAFNEILPKLTGGYKYSLPMHKDRLSAKLREYQRLGYAYLIDGRNRNENAREVTPQMIQLWRELYAGQRGLKPTHVDIYRLYQQFLAGQKDIMCVETAELYDHTAAHYVPAAESTIYEYQNLWEHKVGTHALRSGDRQVFKGLYEPYHALGQPQYAGSIISVDDRQPPFEYAPGKRIWLYIGIDLGSEAITSWVWGDSKEGIILDFYRQMVRNYAHWGIQLPAELEGEMSLNSSYMGTFLQPGAMFQHVRIEANNARGKRIERHIGKWRYEFEKKREGFIGRPFARSEANQRGAGKVPIIPKETIVQNALEDIRKWNESLHSNQALHPDMTCWDVFLDKQHPAIRPTNWAGILPHLGWQTDTSVKAGRAQLQGMGRLLGRDGQIALGSELIDILRQVEGQPVDVRWLDAVDGSVLKAYVYDRSGTLICELLPEPRYSRATIEQTPEDEARRQIMSSYVSTVQAFIRQSAGSVREVMVMEREQPRRQGRFVMPGLEPAWQPDGQDAIVAPPAADEDYSEPDQDTDFKIDTASRY